MLEQQLRRDFHVMCDRRDVYEYPVPLRPSDGRVSVEDGDAGDVERNPSPPVREQVPLRPIDGRVSVEDGDAGDVERKPSPSVREQVIQWLKNNWKIFSLVLSLGLVTGLIGYFIGRGTNHSGSVAPDLEPAPTAPYNAPGNIRGQPGPDWIFYKNISYYYSEEKLNWTSSKEFCESHGAQLAVLEDPSMKELLNGTGGPSQSVTLNVSNGTSDGTIGRPRNRTPAQKLRWFCQIKVPLWVIFLCLGVVVIVIVVLSCIIHTRSPSPSPSPCPSECPTDWPQINGYCYYLSDEKMNWTAAEQFCRNHRASLVKMTNNTKNDFKKLNVKDDFWIGLEMDQNVWKWTDGTQYNETVADYVIGSQLNCAYLNGMIRALDCGTPRRFICGKTVGGIVS